ncbi:hypothetical protein HMPREF3178_19685 [Klebsiella sp. HMSC09D12]|nr:hypothetical protein HMPREF3178_19685 [Klebsiella sp. HMSC09D12]TXU90515.1 hypothetical protein D4M90_25190 [Klebsiella oxytoca]
MLLLKLLAKNPLYTYVKFMVRVSTMRVILSVLNVIMTTPIVGLVIIGKGVLSTINGIVKRIGINALNA